MILSSTERASLQELDIFKNICICISHPLTLPHLESYRKVIKCLDKIKQTSIYKNILVTFDINPR